MTVKWQGLFSNKCCRSSILCLHRLRTDPWSLVLHQCCPRFSEQLPHLLGDWLLVSIQVTGLSQVAFYSHRIFQLQRLPLRGQFPHQSWLWMTSGCEESDSSSQCENVQSRGIHRDPVTVYCNHFPNHFEQWRNCFKGLVHSVGSPGRVPAHLDKWVFSTRPKWASFFEDPSVKTRALLEVRPLLESKGWSRGWGGGKGTDCPSSRLLQDWGSWETPCPLVQSSWWR